VSDISIHERPGVTQLQLVARNGKTAELAANISRFLARKTALAPSEGAANKGLFICATGPREYWVFTQTQNPSEAIEVLSKIIGSSASLFDQSQGKYVVRLAGKHVSGILAKGTALDLHRDAFPALGASHTVIEHIPALVARYADYHEISVPRSYANSFITWLREAAREYGQADILAR